MKTKKILLQFNLNKINNNINILFLFFFYFIPKLILTFLCIFNLKFILKKKII